MTALTEKMDALVLRGTCGAEQGLIDWLGAQGARVEVVDTFDEAVRALQAEQFDLVISQASQFLPLENIQLANHAEVILDSMAQGVSFIDESGQMIWANPKMLDFPKEVRERVTKLCRETFSAASNGIKSELKSTNVAAVPIERQATRRFSFLTKNGDYYELTATPVIDLNQRVTRVAGVVWNATHARRLQEKLDAIDRAGRELISLDVEQIGLLSVQERLDLLEQKIVRCTRELLHYDNFLVRVLDKDTNRLELVLSSGIPLDAQHIDLFASSEGSGISGYVVHQGRSYICPDVDKDHRYVKGMDGARSSLTVPLTLHDRVVGVLNIESDQPAAFTEDDRQFAEILGRYVAIALHILELLVTERRAATGQLGNDVMAEITAPVNDILTEVSTLIEDYIGHDDLRHRLNKISGDAVAIRETVKELTSLPRGVVGHRTGRKTQADPILGGKRILVADDEEVIRNTVRDVLISYGCDVTTAADGAEAVSLVQAGDFDLVLSDIRMPEKSGYEVFAAAKDANSNTQVVLMTGFGYDPNHSVVRARREGLVAVLFKPFKVDQLVSEIRSAVQHHSS